MPERRGVVCCLYQCSPHLWRQVSTAEGLASMEARLLTATSQLEHEVAIVKVQPDVLRARDATELCNETLRMR